jgi:hypothetical protein
VLRQIYRAGVGGGAGSLTLDSLWWRLRVQLLILSAGDSIVGGR